MGQKSKLKRRYLELQSETPVQRVRIMSAEFGPHWAIELLTGKPLPKKLVLSKRHLDWHANKKVA